MNIYKFDGQDCFNDGRRSKPQYLTTLNVSPNTASLPRMLVLQSILKSRNANALRSLDDDIAGLCLADLNDYTAFLRMHQFAFRTLSGTISQGHWLHGLLVQMRGLLDQDLQSVQSQNNVATFVPALPQIDVLGICYVVCRAHSQRAYWQQQVSQSPDDCVRGATEYLDSDVLARGWDYFIAELHQSAQPVDLIAGLADPVQQTCTILRDGLAAVKQWPKAHAAA